MGVGASEIRSFHFDLGSWLVLVGLNYKPCGWPPATPRHLTTTSMGIGTFSEEGVQKRNLRGSAEFFSPCHPTFELAHPGCSVLGRQKCIAVHPDH